MLSRLFNYIIEGAMPTLGAIRAMERGEHFRSPPHKYYISWSESPSEHIRSGFLENVIGVVQEARPGDTLNVENEKDMMAVQHWLSEYGKDDMKLKWKVRNPAAQPAVPVFKAA
jgi:hypothetical protein